MNPRALDVYVLYGGDSPEREISLQSGTAVAGALQGLGYQVTLIDPMKCSLRELQWGDDPVAIIMLHGTYGEDGGVQAELEALGIPYSGSDIESSSRAFHKDVTKQLCRESGMATPPWKKLSADSSQAGVEEAADAIGIPLVVKPEAQGSSLGVSILANLDDVWEAFQAASRLDENVLIERAILGEEWTVPILDHEALPPIRIRSQRPFFDYSAKYEDNETEYLVVDTDDSPIAQAVIDLGLAACQKLKTSGVCRVDLMVDESGTPWLLEVNTIPGMTDHSLVPKSAAHLGWSMQSLCERILFSALPERYKR